MYILLILCFHFCTAEFEVKVANCKRIQSEGANKVKELENMVKNAKEIRERELKLAEKEMLNLKKKAEDSRAQWLKREQVSYESRDY